MDIHIGHVIAYFLAFEVCAFLLALAIVVNKWVRYYRNFSNGWAVATTSEARLQIVFFFVIFNILGAIVAVAHWMLTLLGARVTW